MGRKCVGAGFFESRESEVTVTGRAFGRKVMGSIDMKYWRGIISATAIECLLLRKKNRSDLSDRKFAVYEDILYGIDNTLG